MSKSDWLNLFTIAVFVCILVEVPYIIVRWHPPQGYVFRGSFWAPHDLSQYLSAAHQGMENGSWLIYDRLAPESHSPAFIFPLYVLIGHLANLFHLQIEEMHRVLLSLSRISLVFAVYWFISAYVATPGWRRFGTLFVLFSSGFGAWIAIRLGLLYPQAIIRGVGADLTYVETNTFLTLFSYPHLMLGLGALLVCARTWLLYLRNARYVWLALLCMSIVALGFMNPFSLPVLLLVLSGHALALWILRYENWRRLALALGFAIAISLPFVAYSYLTFSSGTFWGTIYGTQNKLPSPNPLQLISPLGVAGVIAIFGFRACLSKPSLERLLLVVAVLTLFVLMYVPVPYQRRFGFGLHPVVVCLALVGIEEVVRSLRARTEPTDSPDVRGSSRPVVMIAIFAFLGFLVIFTNSVFYFSANITATAPIAFDDRQPDVFEPIGLVSAREWLTKDDNADQVVLAHHRSGNFLAASIPGRVFTGHWTATKDFVEKNKAVERFFSLDTEDSWRRQLLADYRITHVVYGPWERQLGTFDPASCEYLHQAYSENGVSVFRVMRLTLTAREQDS